MGSGNSKPTAVTASSSAAAAPQRNNVQDGGSAKPAAFSTTTTTTTGESKGSDFPAGPAASQGVAVNSKSKSKSNDNSAVGRGEAAAVNDKSERTAHPGELTALRVNVNVKSTASRRPQSPECVDGVQRLAQKILVRNRMLKSFKTRRRSAAASPTRARPKRRASLETMARAKVMAVHRGKQVVVQQSVPIERFLTRSKELAEQKANRPATPTSGSMPPFLVEKLRGHYLFASLSDEVMQSLVEIMRRRVARRDEYIMRQGQITHKAMQDVARILSGNGEGLDVSNPMAGRTDHRFYILEQGALQIRHNGVNSTEVHEPGSCIGDVALLYDTHARTSALVKSEEAVLWSLDREDYQAVQVATKINGIVETLQRIPALQPVPKAELPHFAMVVGEKRLPANTYVYTAGQTDERMYIIRSGSAHVVVNEQNCEVVTLEPGQWFGEEVFQQAVQIERRRSTLVTGELNRQIQAMQLAAALTASGDLAAAAEVRQRTPKHHALDSAAVLSSANNKVKLALSDDEETLPYTYSVFAGEGRLRLLAVPRWRLMSLLECVEEEERDRIVHTLCHGCVKGAPRTRLESLPQEPGRWQSGSSKLSPLMRSLSSKNLESKSRTTSKRQAKTPRRRHRKDKEKKSESKKSGKKDKKGHSRKRSEGSGGSASSNSKKGHRRKKSTESGGSNSSVTLAPIVSRGAGSDRNLEDTSPSADKVGKPPQHNLDDSATSPTVKASKHLADSQGSSFGGRKQTILVKEGSLGDVEKPDRGRHTTEVFHPFDGAAHGDGSQEDDNSQLVHDYNLNAMERVGNVGVGGFGLVILVRYSSEGEKPYSTNQSENEGDKELLALKLLNKKQIVAGEQQEAVVREVEILTALRDCNLALHLLGTMQDQANLYLLTEYIDGSDLFELMSKQPDAFTDAVIRHFSASILSVLHFLHAPPDVMIFRDIKPENIMVTHEGYVKLIDFGIARRLASESSNADSQLAFTLVGTPEYVAPEVLLGQGYGPSADLWSVGILMFEMFCGFTPFADEEDAEEDAIYMRIIQEDLSVHLDCLEGNLCNVVTQLLERDVDLRIGCRHSTHNQDSILELMNHPYFADVDWQGLSNGHLENDEHLLKPPSKLQNILQKGFKPAPPGASLTGATITEPSAEVQERWDKHFPWGAMQKGEQRWRD